MTDKKLISDAEINKSYWFDIAHDHTIATYSSGEIVGTLGELKVKGGGGGGYIDNINVICGESQAFPIRIWFFRAPPSAFADGDSFIPLWNDCRKIAKYVDVAAGKYVSYGANRIAVIDDANVKFSAPGGKLYYYVEAQGAATFAALGRMLISFGDWPD